ncbi:MAG: DinB family protein [Crocinitomicaceae bacterium]|nr:DinB family protein [Crocinitomicaceae bacterium]
MSRLDFLLEQYQWTDKWTNSIIEDIEEAHWGYIDEAGTSINWLFGHQVISKYFHSIISILKADGVLVRDLNKEIPLETYFKYYFAGSDPRADWKQRPGKEELMRHWNLLCNVCTEMIPLLNEPGLDSETEIKNPVAKTKYEALAFTFKHQMWHNGQIAMVKRILRNQ